MNFSSRVFAHVSDRAFHEYIGRINKELDFVQFEARASRNQYDGEIYYGVVNKVADEHAKLGTQYSLRKSLSSRPW